MKPFKIEDEWALAAGRRVVVAGQNLSGEVAPGMSPAAHRASLPSFVPSMSRITPLAARRSLPISGPHRVRKSNSRSASTIRLTGELIVGVVPVGAPSAVFQGAQNHLPRPSALVEVLGLSCSP